MWGFMTSVDLLISGASKLSLNIS